MKHPLEAMPQGKRLGVFLALLAVFLVMTIGFRFIGPVKRTSWTLSWLALPRGLQRLSMRGTRRPG